MALFDKLDLSEYLDPVIAKPANPAKAAEALATLATLAGDVGNSQKSPSEISERNSLTISGWINADWVAWFNERAGILEYDHGLSRRAANAQAWECCIVEWLNQHPQPSQPGRCAACGKSENNGSIVVPFGIGPNTWLHPHCWESWHQDRRRLAVAELTPILKQQEEEI